jgi:mono/diheme cytochrome c family protein
MITNGEEEMPSFKNKLTQDEINLMVRYIRKVVQAKG